MNKLDSCRGKPLCYSERMNSVRPHQTKARLLLLLPLMLLMALTWDVFARDHCNESTPCWSFSRGAKSPDLLAGAYLQALQNRDSQALLNLIPENHDAGQEVRYKMDKLGGQEVADRQLDFQENRESPFYGILSITGRIKGSDHLFKDKLALQKSNQRWYLIMGCVPASQGGITGGCHHLNFGTDLPF